LVGINRDEEPNGWRSVEVEDSPKTRGRGVGETAARRKGGTLRQGIRQERSGRKRTGEEGFSDRTILPCYEEVQELQEKWKRVAYRWKSLGMDGGRGKKRGSGRPNACFDSANSSLGQLEADRKSGDGGRTFRIRRRESDLVVCRAGCWSGRSGASSVVDDEADALGGEDAAGDLARGGAECVDAEEDDESSGRTRTSGLMLESGVRTERWKKADAGDSSFGAESDGSW
jgi:hypothetical protein